MTEAASPSSITFGTQDTLSVSGLPGDAAGIVNFISGVVILCTAVLPRISCQTATTLPAGSHNVVAVYSGDGNYISTIANGASFTVVPATPSFTESASPVSIDFGSTGHALVSGTRICRRRNGDLRRCVGYPVHGGAAHRELHYIHITAAWRLTSLQPPIPVTRTTLVHLQRVRVSPSSRQRHRSVSWRPRGPRIRQYRHAVCVGNPGGATGSVTFTSSGVTLCAATLASLSCQTSTTLAPGTYAVNGDILR